ncbi:hypothetical protein COU37_04245 [Candidatus Micrarchaeota archaeon CG10_big_fil_rev_8_21_14_0_10_45_29]|nr:MAG: hypothetical protein COU37_04245 [Candidatus Micrarchaeota archaeon CG10_big_fil_rev_8_21_14_0_10_45_29]
MKNKLPNISKYANLLPKRILSRAQNARKVPSGGLGREKNYALENFEIKSLKGQSAVETLLIAGVGLLFLIPLVLMFYSSTNLGLDDLSRMQAKAMAQQIADAAGQVWYEGKGARRTILVNAPDGISDIFLSPEISRVGEFSLEQNKAKGKDIIIKIEDESGGQSQIVYISPAPVFSSVGAAGGDAKASLDYNRGVDGKLSPGLSVLIIKNEGTYVNIVRFYPGINY